MLMGIAQVIICILKNNFNIMKRMPERIITLLSLFIMIFWSTSQLLSTMESKELNWQFYSLLFSSIIFWGLGILSLAYMIKGFKSL